MKKQALVRIVYGTSVALFVVMFATLAWSAQDKSLPPTLKNETDGAAMILIPSGSFLMGTIASEVDEDFRETGLPQDWKKHTLDERPRHRQTVDLFYLYKYEVTNSQYKAFTVATGHRTPPHWNGRIFRKVREITQWLR